MSFSLSDENTNVQRAHNAMDRSQETSGMIINKCSKSKDRHMLLLQKANKTKNKTPQKSINEHSRSVWIA